MRNFLFLSTAWFFFLPISVSPAASDFISTHTYTTPIELEPVSFADLKNSYQTAGVCFLGFGGCGDDGRFSTGSTSSGSASTGSDDFDIDTVAQCKNEGFTITSCPSGSAASGTTAILTPAFLMTNSANRTTITNHVPATSS